MTREEIHQNMLTVFEECSKLWIEKNKEYNDDSNPFANFDNSAQRSGVDREKVLLIYMEKQYGAICKYIRDGHMYSINETIHSRIKDTINFLIMLDSMILDKELKELSDKHNKDSN